jgi:hypothetical protein
MDDQADGFSKRKYESINAKTRRMGEKKKAIKVSMKKSADSKFRGKKKHSKTIKKNRGS